MKQSGVIIREEWVSFAEGAVVERKQGSPALIRNIVLLGPVSKNGRLYPRATLERRAPLFEGVRAFFNHNERSGSGGRDVRDLIGQFRNVRFAEDGKIRGDLVTLGTPDTDRVVLLAENMPNAAGFSPHMSGVVRRDREQREIVEDITVAHSVDLVSNPATTQGLHEEVRPKEKKGMELTEATLDALRRERPDLIEAMKKEAEAGEAFKKLQEENKGLREQITKMEESGREGEIVKLCEGLPEKVVEQIKAMAKGKSIDEVKGLVTAMKESIGHKTAPNQPQSTERVLEGSTGAAKKVAELTLQDIAEAFRSN